LVLHAVVRLGAQLATRLVESANSHHSWLKSASRSELPRPLHAWLRALLSFLQTKRDTELVRRVLLAVQLRRFHVFHVVSLRGV